MPAIAERPPVAVIICQTTTAASPDSEVLYALRKQITQHNLLPHFNKKQLFIPEEAYANVEVDFPPMTVAEIANQHHQFLANLQQRYYEVELIDDPA